MSEPAFQLSEKAVNEILKLVSNNKTLKSPRLRVKVIGGGCSGMSYKLDFEESPEDLAQDKEENEVFSFQGVNVAIDKRSLLFVKGTTLDFSDGLSGRGFEFNNPNAKRTCGCGSSFSA